MLSVAKLNKAREHLYCNLSRVVVLKTCLSQGPFILLNIIEDHRRTSDYEGYNYYFLY